MGFQVRDPILLSLLFTTFASPRGSTLDAFDTTVAIPAGVPNSDEKPDAFLNIAFILHTGKDSGGVTQRHRLLKSESRLGSASSSKTRTVQRKEVGKGAAHKTLQGHTYLSN
ncbi:hypothetical protein CEP51_011609 [Fusarium floridanum]|uniref:Secreted protein n=1 Tax=Fusarium floridanum TaxID=1325733 RepID=A0A428R9W9_9HYPO|nr:hypothetical protein CEP51_011609 [Fusarium floridanum]